MKNILFGVLCVSVFGAAYADKPVSDWAQFEGCFLVNQINGAEMPRGPYNSPHRFKRDSAFMVLDEHGHKIPSFQFMFPLDGRTNFHIQDAFLNLGTQSVEDDYQVHRFKGNLKYRLQPDSVTFDYETETRVKWIDQTHLDFSAHLSYESHPGGLDNQVDVTAVFEKVPDSECP